MADRLLLMDQVTVRVAKLDRVGDNLKILIEDGLSTTEVEIDACDCGANVLQFTNRIVLPIAAAEFLGIRLQPEATITSIGRTPKVIKSSEISFPLSPSATPVGEISKTSVEEEAEEDKCNIYGCDHPEYGVLPRCHKVCPGCFSRLDRPTCPICRVTLDANAFPELSALASTSAPARLDMVYL